MSNRSENPRGWTHVALVFLFMLINYADKSIVGLAGVPIMRELGLSNRQFGLLGSAFFLLFSAAGIAVGLLANRTATKRLMFVMGVVWAAALLPMSIASSFGLLLLTRVILGAAEGPAFPIALHAVYKWFPDQRRALPTSIVASGAAFGSGVIAPVVTWVILRWGWHAAFGCLGLAGLLWAVGWFFYAEEGPLDRADATRFPAGQRVAYRDLLSSRTTLGVFLAGFGAYWVLALNIVWLANYVNKALHIAPAAAAWIVALPAVMQMALAPAAAWLSQRLMERGVSSRVARGLLGAGCVVASGLSMIGMALLDLGTTKIVLIGSAFSVGSVIFTLGSTLIGEISPAPQRGAMLGITNSFHTLAGLFAPFAMGLMVDVGANPGAGFREGFLYAGGLVIGLGVLAGILIDPEGDRARQLRRREKSGDAPSYRPVL